MSDQINTTPPLAANQEQAGTGHNGWARLDTPAATPRNPHGNQNDGQQGGGSSRLANKPSLRLARSRSQVLSALDGGGSVLQRRGRDVLVGSSLLLAPLVALNLWATTLAFDRTGATTLKALGTDDIGTGIEDVAVLLVVVFASFAASLVGFFVVTILIADRFGSNVTLGGALRSTGRRLPAVFIAWALGHLWVPILAIWPLTSRFDQVAGRLMLVAIAAALISTATVMVIPVMVAERAGPFRSLKRSWRLARIRYGSLLGFVVTSAVIGALVLGGIALLPAMAEWTGLLNFGDYLWLAQGIAGQLGVILVVPLIALATAQMYIEVRLDAEGMDIALDADAAFGRRDAQR